MADVVKDNFTSSFIILVSFIVFFYFFIILHNKIKLFNPTHRHYIQISSFFVAGRSHDKSFTLFRLGTKSSAGIKQFAETGRSDILEEQSQGEGGIYDEFNAPPIAQGVGRTEAEFFVDGNHSRVRNESVFNSVFVQRCRNGCYYSR